MTADKQMELEVLTQGYLEAVALIVEQPWHLTPGVNTWAALLGLAAIQ